jgi:hypothetical protein
MQLEHLFRVIQSHSHGGSSSGKSFWEKAAKCGRDANLSIKHKEQAAAARAAELEQTEEIDAMETGTYFHALQENGLRGQLEATIWDQTDEAYDMHFNEAVRLYRGYVAAWGSVLERFGAELIGVEVPLGSDPAVAGRILQKYGHPLTGRADAIIRIVDADKCYANTGLLLAQGSKYLFDHKSAGQRNQKQDYEFTFGNQAITYCLLYNEEYPTDPVEGFVFDLTVRHKTLRKEPELDKNGKLRAGKSFHAFLAQVLAGDDEIVRNLMRIGAHNMANDLANSAQCFSGFRPCFWFTNGVCSRK